MKPTEVIFLLLLLTNLLFSAICNSRLIDLSNQLDNFTPELVIQCNNDHETDN